ncbi:hypothetical protein KDA_76930 [Dictyobacter alpinus]|uniref:Uncharacterized protein n=2 Tax=Dictyobacter alpinus TaxID=2014873 RepID=A0A402BLK0_9CHLR|nr:hypothetical protein KDA_76930 [Dictyobacter alpinus]
MSSSSNHNQKQPEAQAALYGPAGRADYRPGDQIRFRSVATSGQILTGTVLYVRAPGPAIQGGKNHPTVLVMDAGDGFPHMVYPGDVIQE